MKRLLLTLSLALFCFIIYGQQRELDLYPVALGGPDISKESRKFIDRRDHLLKVNQLTIQERKELQNMMLSDSDVLKNVWQVTDSSKGWYKYGGNYKVESSTSLASIEGVRYDAYMANDLSYATAWVVSGPGIGESISYYFKPELPRIKTICISNGVVNCEKLWLDHNRVKRLQLRVNGVIYATLHLSNTRLTQYFELDIPLNKPSSGKDLILRFEILDIYPGAKYNQTALTEIYFDGESR